MIQTLNFTSTFNNVPAAYPYNKCTIKAALEQQKYRRGIELYYCDQGKHASRFNQDEYINELKHRRINRLDNEEERVKMIPHEEYEMETLGVEQEKDDLAVPLIVQTHSTHSTLSLRDVSNVSMHNRVDENNPAIEANTSLLSLDDENDYNNRRDDENNPTTATLPASVAFNDNDYSNEWEDLEIEASKTFDEDEDEEESFFELEIGHSNSFDKDKDLFFSFEQEEGSASPLHSVRVSKETWFRMLHDVKFQHR